MIKRNAREDTCPSHLPFSPSTPFLTWEECVPFLHQKYSEYHCLDQVASSKKPYIIHRYWNSLRGWIRADVSLSTQVSHIRKPTSLDMWQHGLLHHHSFFPYLSLHSLVDPTSKSYLCVAVRWRVTMLRFLHYYSHRKKKNSLGNRTFFLERV